MKRLARLSKRFPRLVLHRRIWAPWAALLVLVAGLALLVAFNHWLALSHTRPWTFGLAWGGLRAWLFHGASPYDLTAIRRELTPWLTGTPPPWALPTPLISAWWYFPLALIPSGPLAYALWLTGQQILLLLWAGAMVRMLAHRSWAWALLLGLSFLWPATWETWRTGSPLFLATVLLGLAWTAFMQERDAAAGFLFLGVTLDWPTLALPLVAWGMWALGRGRRDGPLTWGMVFVAVGVVAQWLQPRWWVEYLLALRQWGGAGLTGLPALALAIPRIFPGLGLRVGLTLSLVLFLWMLVHWGRAWVGSPWTAYWTWFWTLTASAGLALRTGPDLAVLLLPGLFLALTAWWHRWRYGRHADLGLVLLMWSGGWGLYQSTTPETFTALAMLAGLPLTLLLLASVRWWFVRPEPWWTVEVEWS